MLLVAFRLHSDASEAFWTVLAYVAIFHFIKPLYGFVAIYRLRAAQAVRRVQRGRAIHRQVPAGHVSDLMFAHWAIASIYVARQLLCGSGGTREASASAWPTPPS